MEARAEEGEGACFICLESDPPLIRSGCTCRGSCAYRHIECLKEGCIVWRQCRVCLQDFTGAARLALAELWRSQVESQGVESTERLAAESNLASALLDTDRVSEAELLLRRLGEVQKSVLGSEHPDTLETAASLAMALTNQGKYAEAERIDRAMLGVHTRVRGAEHPNTLKAASQLATPLAGQGKFAEAERISRAVLEAQTHILGPSHLDTLQTASRLAISLSCQGKCVDAMMIDRNMLERQVRVLGPEHPDTLKTAARMAIRMPLCPSNQGKHADAEDVLQRALDKLDGTAHLYLSVRVATDADLQQHGDVDLVRFDDLPARRWKKSCSLAALKVLSDRHARCAQAATRPRPLCPSALPVSRACSARAPNGPSLRKSSALSRAGRSREVAGHCAGQAAALAVRAAGRTARPRRAGKCEPQGSGSRSRRPTAVRPDGRLRYLPTRPALHASQ